MRAASTEAAFNRLYRLANIENGLTATSLRTLYKVCVTTIGDYGSQVWWKSKRAVKPLEAIQARAAKRTLGVFRTAPKEPTEIEAGLLPTQLRLEYQAILYGFRLRALPNDTPIALALRSTRLPTTSRPIQDGIQLLPYKPRTTLEVIKTRLAFFSNTDSSQAKSDAKDYILEKWKREYEKKKTSKIHRPQSYFNRFSFQPNLGINLKVERATSSAYYSFRIGHGYFRSYLYYIGKVEHDRCLCGARETPEHILLSCRLYTNLRPIGIRNARSLETILNQVELRDLVLGFIQKTGVGTRKWYLAKGQDEGNEGD